MIPWKGTATKEVLHWDFIIGSMLITGKPDHGDHGVLIDYDSAIPWEDHNHILDNTASVR
jgi:hypothetical protein